MRALALLLLLTCAVSAHAGSFMEDVDFVIRLARLDSGDPSQFGPMRFAAMSASPGATVRYPNGNVFTNYAHQAGATLYYPNGQVATNYAMQTGATWYYPNGKVLTNYMGQSGATWYYDNGSVMVSSGPAFSASQLLDVPSILAQILWGGTL